MASYPDDDYSEQTADIAHILSLPCRGGAWELDEKRKPLEVAIYIVESAASIGYKGMKMFALQWLPTYNCLDVEDFISGSTICFVVYEYFCFWLGIDSKFEDVSGKKIFTSANPTESDMEEVNSLKRAGDTVSVLSERRLNQLKDGLYRCDMNHDNEGHHFLWIILKGDLYYSGGYGGTCGVVSVKFDKGIYFREFIKAMLDVNMDSYKYVFGLGGQAFPGRLNHVLIIKDGRYTPV